jgi:hypothetical protein
MPESINLLIYKTPMGIGTIIEPAFNSDKNKIIKCTEKSWLFVADLHPRNTFRHLIKIGIINNKICTIIDAEWWPVRIVKSQHESLYLTSKEWYMFGHGNTRINDSTSDCVDRSSSLSTYVPITRDCLSSIQASRKLWAIIISGHSDENFVFDANDMYSTLEYYRVPENQIFYITPNKLHLENDSKIFCDDVSLCSIKTCFEVIKGKILPSDKFLFFISTHGSDEKGLSLEIINQNEELLTTESLNDFLSKIKCKTQFIVINACGSGSFICPLIAMSTMSNNRVVIASCKSDEDSCSDVDKLECDLNIGDRGSEFLSGFIESFSKKVADNDIRDDKISIIEAFNYAKKCAWCANNSSIISCYNYNPSYHPQIAYSCGIDPYTEFLFWD